MINWFESAGVSKDQLKDESTAHFIKDVIDQHGGFEAIKKDVERKKTIRRGAFLFLFCFVCLFVFLSFFFHYIPISVSV